MSSPGAPLHSHPFRMLDVVLELEDRVATGIKAVTGDEVLHRDPAGFCGSYPFSLLLETMAQAAIPLAGGDAGHGAGPADGGGMGTGGGVATGGGAGAHGVRGLLVAIDGARLLRPASPGDRLLITSTLTAELGGMIKVKSVAEIAGSDPGSAIVAEAEFTIALQAAS